MLLEKKSNKAKTFKKTAKPKDGVQPGVKQVTDPETGEPVEVINQGPTMTGEPGNAIMIYQGTMNLKEYVQHAKDWIDSVYQNQKSEDEESPSDEEGIDVSDDTAQPFMMDPEDAGQKDMTYGRRKRYIDLEGGNNAEY